MEILDIEDFWEREKYLVKTHKTSQEKIADLMGMPYNTLRNWIHYKRMPDARTVCDLSLVLGVSVEFLVYGKERKIVEERNKRLLERKTAAAAIKRLARVILKQSRQI